MTPTQASVAYGENPERSFDELEAVLNAQRAAFEQRPVVPWSDRKKRLQALWEVLEAYESDFVAAISSDFGNRAAEETAIAEMLVIQGGVNHALKHTPRWMKTRRAAVAWPYWPAKNRIMPQPLGVIGIISPWNYPLQLALMPLIGAIGAGNRAMIKPSELTPLYSAKLRDALAEAFPMEEVFVATGGVETAKAFAALRFDHLVFTGSTAVGREVAKAAAKNLTPVTLELGGKTPAIVDDTADFDLIIPRLAQGKLLNAGQTCVAPDYVLISPSRIDTFSDAMLEQATVFYPQLGGNKDYTSIISDRHFARLQDLVQDAENKGAKIRTVGAEDERKLAAERRMPLTLITNTTPDMRIMQEEIFGPLLPIVPAETLDDALRIVRAGDRPLALYWFGEDRGRLRRVLDESISGGVSVNECSWHVIQESLPFGGVGASGMGAYHGEAGFDNFSHVKGVFYQTRWSQGNRLYPPYGKATHKMIEFMKRIL